MPCRCGNNGRCRGTVDDFDKLPALIQEFYLKEGIVMSFIAKNRPGA
jgi:hypothetical protein